MATTYISDGLFLDFWPLFIAHNCGDLQLNMLPECLLSGYTMKTRAAAAALNFANV